ncbi:MAG: PAS domain-containing protein [Caulobacterales bacterium]|nr:PAS domain-containing protein [Caulobacterales bacterium]
MAAFRDWGRSADPAAGSAVAETSNDSYRAALESLPDPVLIVDGGPAEDLSARAIVYANSAAQALLKVTGRGEPLVAALRDPAALEAVDGALYGQVVHETAYEPAGAQERFWRISATPLLIEASRGRLAVVRFRDETDSLRMERMRADFLANASHELKTPLASLQGFIETLKGHARDDERARDRFLDIMSTQTARMSRMIADLLALSRIELVEHISPAGRADVALAARDVVDALAPLLKDLDGQVELVVRTRPALIVGDRDQLIQVIQNLTENAVRYSPPGRLVQLVIEGDLTQAEAQASARSEAARLTILTPDRVADARYVVVRVVDQGHGLAREQLPRLTERFYRVEGQKSGHSPGTGLGLSIVKHIVNRHKGGMVVESQPDVGTTFTVYFPMAGPVGVTTPGRAA